MNNRNLAILAAATVAVIVITVVLHSGGPPAKRGFSAGELLIQGLNPDSVHRIEIKSSKDAATLLRRGKSFVVADKNDYPASAKSINDLIMKALDIRLAEKVTENPENHSELGVAENSDEAVSVIFKKDENTPLIGFVKGKNAEQGGGLYVRLAGNNTVYRAENHLWLNASPLDYIERKLVDAAKEDIQRVEVTVEDETYAIARDDSNVIRLDGIPEGKKAKGKDYENVFNLLSNLRLSDVKRAGDTELEWDAKYVSRLESGLTYTIESARKDGKNYVRLSAAAPRADRVEISRTESDEELKKKEAMLIAADTAEKFNSRHKGWVYEIASYDATTLRKPFSQLIEDVEPEPEEASEPQEAVEPAEMERTDEVEAEPEVQAETPADTETPAE